MTKLVAWESQDLKALTEMLDQFVHLRVITHCCASQGCYILYQHHLALIFRQGDRLTAQKFDREVKDLLGCTRHFG